MTLDPLRARRDVVLALLQARSAGRTLRQAAAQAGVHVATLCRWQASSAVLAAALDRAAAEADERRRWSRRPRPWVRWHPGCPACRRQPVTVSAVGGLVRFWRCPAEAGGCGWLSWRPRTPEDCPRCGGPRFWSHSRKSFSCPGCGQRWWARPTWLQPAGRQPWPFPPLRPATPPAELLAAAEAAVAAHEGLPEYYPGSSVAEVLREILAQGRVAEVWRQLEERRLWQAGKWWPRGWRRR
jgi:hypothetical protein